ncbi:CHAT domain-containing protein [Amycolatopsis speibonae]|uniref:CHAT domain-containing protein n=1 Tax=Amycolatopsis speibonae TaxID=1450224 RepID=A0ABV7P5C8_9PSEU
MAPDHRSPKDIGEHARELHRKGIDATNSGHPVRGARLLRAALRLLDRPAPADGTLVARVLSTLGGVEVVLGNSDHGFELLDAAEEMPLAPGDRGALRQQRGLALILVGRMTDALACFDEAIPLLRRSGEPVALARALLNRALLHQTAGRVRLALADLDACAEIARAHGAVDGLPRTLAKALQGRGQAKVLTGDIPGALRDFSAAAEVYAEHGEGMLAPLAVDKGRALLAAGLPSEAAAELDLALARFPRLRMDQEHAEAELTRARAALAAGDLAGARRWAGRARRRFRRRGNDTWAEVAALTLLRADFTAGGRMKPVAVDAAELATRLTRLGLRNDAETAKLLAARANIAHAEPDAARAALEDRALPGGPLANRLLRYLARAELAWSTGDRRTTLAQARAGLKALEAYRNGFGSLDLRTGVASLGRDLAKTGLTAAWATGSPEVVFRWLERSRAQAFGIQQVHRPDGETADAVAELRQLAGEIRAAELDGTSAAEARRRCTELERRIRARGWEAEGAALQVSRATYRGVREELSKRDSVLIGFLADKDRFRAMVIDGRRASLLDLGDATVVSEALMRLQSDLNAVCGRTLPPALERVIRASVRRQVGVLAQELITPLLPELGDADVVVVPTGVLSIVPWGLLGPLRGRPVTVAPSPSAWLALSTAPAPETSDHAAVLAVAGPGLEHAASEAGRVAKVYPRAEVLAGNDATIEATSKALAEYDSVHLAAHGHHEQENVLFSRLDLADGPLMAYDVQLLESVPAHVVLSACDIGQAVVRPGDEILGFTAALLYSGSRTVISSVARVDDGAVVQVMESYHRALARGTVPARALADATCGEVLMPLVCFGR